MGQKKPREMQVISETDVKVISSDLLGEPEPAFKNPENGTEPQSLEEFYDKYEGSGEDVLSPALPTEPEAPTLNTFTKRSVDAAITAVQMADVAEPPKTDSWARRPAHEMTDDELASALEAHQASGNPILQWFRWRHLPSFMHRFSRPWAELAVHVCESSKPGPERTTAFRKLLEGKDCAVRAGIADTF